MALITIDTDMLEEIDLNPDEETEAAQNIAVLLATREGSVPLDREIGIPMDYIDMPGNLAESQLEAELSMAVAEQETGLAVEVVEARFTEDGKARVMVEVVENGDRD